MGHFRNTSYFFAFSQNERVFDFDPKTEEFVFDAAALKRLQDNGNDSIDLIVPPLKNEEKVKDQIMKDHGRGFFTINGVFPKDMTRDNIEEHLKLAGFTPEHIKSFLKYYNQIPSFLVTNPFMTATNGQMGFQEGNEEVDIYLKDNKIYYQTKRSQFTSWLNPVTHHRESCAPILADMTACYVLIDEDFQPHKGFQPVDLRTKNPLVARLLNDAKLNSRTNTIENHTFDLFKEAYLEDDAEQQCAFLENELHVKKAKLAAEIEQTLIDHTLFGAYRSCRSESGFDPNLDLDLNHPQIKNLKAKNNAFNLAVAKYEIVRDLYDAIKPASITSTTETASTASSKEMQSPRTAVERLEGCYATYSENRKTLATIRASGFKGFLQKIGEFLGIWKSKATAFIEKLEGASALKDHSMWKEKHRRQTHSIWGSVVQTCRNRIS